jgi:uncharacterized tellurite resistance protein B-like protein
MLRTLKDLFDSIVAPPSGAAAPQREHTLQLATAVLLVEVMRSDADIGDAERAAVVAALGQTSRWLLTNSSASWSSPSTPRASRTTCTVSRPA